MIKRTGRSRQGVVLQCRTPWSLHLTYLAPLPASGGQPGPDGGGARQGKWRDQGVLHCSPTPYLDLPVRLIKISFFTSYLSFFFFLFFLFSALPTFLSFFLAFYLSILIRIQIQHVQDQLSFILSFFLSLFLSFFLSFSLSFIHYRKFAPAGNCVIS